MSTLKFRIIYFMVLCICLTNIEAADPDPLASRLVGSMKSSFTWVLDQALIWGKDEYIFIVKDDRGKDEKLKQIPGYIRSKIRNGKNQDLSGEYWAYAHKDDAMWFYLTCSKSEAENLFKTWSDVLEDFFLRSESPAAISLDMADSGADVLLDESPSGGDSLSDILNGNLSATFDETSVKNKRMIDSRSPGRDVVYRYSLDNDRGRDRCLISQIPDEPLPPAPRDKETHCYFKTDMKPGQGVFIYVVDTHFNIKHEQFSHLDLQHIHVTYPLFDPKDKRDHPPKPKWAAIRSKKYLKMYEKNSGHGMQVLSKIVGSQVGMAPWATPILIKTTDSNLMWNDFNVADRVWRVAQDIEYRIKGNQNRQFIVNCSWNFKISGDTPQDFETNSRYRSFHKIREAMRLFAKMPNVLVVTSAGNDKEDVPIGEYNYPAALARFPDEYPNLIVVGGVNVYPRTRVFQTAPYVKVSGPAKSQIVPYINDTRSDRYILQDGTSFAASTVSGVLAVLISRHGHTAPEAQRELYRLAYPRGPYTEAEKDLDFPSVVYNGLGLPRNQMRQAHRTYNRGRGLNVEESDDSGIDEAPVPPPASDPDLDMTSIRDAIEKISTTIQQQQVATATEYACSLRRKVKRNDKFKSNSTDTGDTETITVTICTSDLPNPTSSVPADSEISVDLLAADPIPSFEYVYNATFCKVCLEADGTRPVEDSSVIWIPQDCPCKAEDRAKYAL